MTESTIIKSGSLQASEMVRTLVQRDDENTANQRVERTSPPTHISAEMTLIEELRTDNQRLNAMVSQHRAEVEKIRKEEFDRGHAAGEKDAATEEAKRTETVSVAVAKAVAEFQKKLDSLEGLAILLARTGLDHIFADHRDLDTLIANAITHRLDILKEHSIVAIFVSPVDFKDEEALAHLKNAIGDTKLGFETDRNLVSGDCRLSLKLGEVEIGVTPQLKRLDNLLRDLTDKMES